MIAFIDGRCAKCNARIGWSGTLRDKPPCHKCKHKPTEAELKELEEVERKLEAMEKELLKD